MPRLPSLAQTMLLAAVAGIALGFAAPDFAKSLSLVSDIFLRLIRAVIAPLLFGVLIRAIAGAGNLRDLGRFGLKSVVCFEVATTLALLLGWAAGLVFQPGVGVTLPVQAPAVAAPTTFTTVLLNVFPTSVIDAMARGDVLQIVVFCFLFGIACLSLGERARPVVVFADALAEVSFRFTQFVMYLAPVAILGAMGATVAAGGLNALSGLARLMAAAWLAEVLFLVVVLGGALVLFRVPLRRFISLVREPFVIGFATTSSAAALPQTLLALERLGVPRPILGVAAPLSLSLNLNGSTIYLGLATLFIAQAAGVNLTWQQHLMILLTLKLTSKGVAGIPRANFVVLAALFPTFGLPVEGLAILLGIDALIDPIRTSVNVASHNVAPAVVAAWEGTDFRAPPATAADTPPPAS